MLDQITSNTLGSSAMTQEIKLYVTNATINDHKTTDLVATPSSEATVLYA